MINLVNKINDQPMQRVFLTGNPGQRIIMDLRFLPTQSLWTADFSLGDFSVEGICVTASPNILRNYRNIIPFGVMVLTDNGQDPRGLDDFNTGYARIYLMDQEETNRIESLIYE